jgi:hypothetical protein
LVCSPKQGSHIGSSQTRRTCTQWAVASPAAHPRAEGQGTGQPDAEHAARERLAARLHLPTRGVAGTAEPWRPPTPLTCVGGIALHHMVSVDALHERIDIRCRVDGEPLRRGITPMTEVPGQAMGSTVARAHVLHGITCPWRSHAACQRRSGESSGSRCARGRPRWPPALSTMSNRTCNI